MTAAAGILWKCHHSRVGVDAGHWFHPYWTVSWSSWIYLDIRVASRRWSLVFVVERKECPNKQGGSCSSQNEMLFTPFWWMQARHRGGPRFKGRGCRSLALDGRRTCRQVSTPLQGGSSYLNGGKVSSCRLLGISKENAQLYCGRVSQTLP